MTYETINFWIIFGGIVGALGIFVILLLIWINSRDY
jgi:hypothetical protein